VPVVAVVVAAVFPNELVPPKLNELPSVVAAGAAEAPNENGEAVQLRRQMRMERLLSLVGLALYLRWSMMVY